LQRTDDELAQLIEAEGEINAEGKTAMKQIAGGR